MRYGHALTWIVVVMLISALVGVAVGDRDQSSKHVPDVDVTSSPELARTPRPPSVGQGSVTANPPEVTPSPEPTQTPVEHLRAAAQPAPAETVEQAREAQTDVHPTPNREVAGSIPAPRATPTPVVESGGNYSSDYSLSGAIAASNWPPHTHAKVYRVVMCESSGNPAAVSPAGYVGLMQVAPWLHGPVPADAVGQLNQGWSVFVEAGRSWRPWPVCGLR